MSPTNFSLSLISLKGLPGLPLEKVKEGLIKLRSLPTAKRLCNSAQGCRALTATLGS